MEHVRRELATVAFWISASSLANRILRHNSDRPHDLCTKDQERHDIGFHRAASAHGDPQPHPRVAAVDVATVAAPSQHMFEKLFPSEVL